MDHPHRVGRVPGRAGDPTHGPIDTLRQRRCPNHNNEPMAGIAATLAQYAPPYPDRAGPVLVAVIGPPGAGKSTIAAALASDVRMSILRLREVIRAHPHVLAGLAPSRDPLGWVSLEAVRRALHAAFIEGHRALRAGPVLLDNFPGTAAQLDLLIEVASLADARIAVLEIRAQTATVVARVAARRVCLACGPDSHAPAAPAAEDPDSCSRCGATLSRRESDKPRLHGLRLARYTANLPEITELAARRGIAHLRMNADRDLAEVHHQAPRTLHQLINFASLEPADPAGSRS